MGDFDGPSYDTDLLYDVGPTYDISIDSGKLTR